MIDKIIDGLIKILLGDLFKKKPWALWAIKPEMKNWQKIGTGSKRRLNMYAATLFGEGWRTLIVAVGITPVPPPEVK